MPGDPNAIPPEVRSVDRILVIKLRHLGDVLLATPVFAALKERYPTAKIYAAVNPGTGQMLAGNPHVTGTLSPSTHKGGKFQKWLHEFRFARAVRAKRCDLAIDLTTSDRSAILTMLSGAKTRLGYRSLKGFWGRRHCYTETVQPVRHEHIVRKHLRILQPLGIENPHPSLVFPISESDRARVQSLIPTGREIFQVHPVSRIAKKNWPIPFLAEAVNQIASRGWLPVITGSSAPEEKEWIAQLCRNISGEFLNLSGKLSLHQSGVVSERARCFIGVDTAPMHIAAAVGAPVIAIFGPSSEKIWAPWCEKSLILSRDDLNCRLPCQDRHHCPHIACLREMRPEMIMSKVDLFLEAI